MAKTKLHCARGPGLVAASLAGRGPVASTIDRALATCLNKDSRTGRMDGTSRTATCEERNGQLQDGWDAAARPKSSNAHAAIIRVMTIRRAILAKGYATSIFIS